MTPSDGRQIYPMAPLIRFTLISLYLALVVPLPLLAVGSLAWLAWIALPLGLVLVVALTSERVELSPFELRVGHPSWCSWLLRRGWSVQWDQITALTPVATSQGGRVYYVRQGQGVALLLPQRVAGFDDFLRRFSTATGLDTRGIGRISPPWTYQLLAVLAGLMLVAELILWVMFRVSNGSFLG